MNEKWATKNTGDTPGLTEVNGLFHKCTARFIEEIKPKQVHDNFSILIATNDDQDLNQKSK